MKSSNLIQIDGSPQAHRVNQGIQDKIIDYDSQMSIKDSLISNRSLDKSDDPCKGQFITHVIGTFNSTRKFNEKLRKAGSKGIEGARRKVREMAARREKDREGNEEGDGGLVR